MKNAIKYYYNLNPYEIHQINKKYKFRISNNNYILYPYTRNLNEINELFELHRYLLVMGIYCHQIILNINNEFITKINNTIYVLLKINMDNRKINIQDIVLFSNLQVDPSRFSTIKRQNWYQLWINKIDYIEYQISQFGKKYPLIRESSDYYIGIVENCISILANIKKDLTLTISHNRINKNTTTEEFYNPLNFIIDKRVRDISEYLKSFMLEEDIIQKLENYIYQNNLSANDIKLLFVRLIYPSSYFDTYETIISDKQEEKEILKIINKHNIYEKSIKKIYHYLRSISDIPEIDWLMNN